MQSSAALAQSKKSSAKRNPSGADARIRIWVVSHTHWDREWYLPFQVFRLFLVRRADELMDVLEADPSFPSFTFDGQGIALEDYLEVRPEAEPRLSRLIREGRIRIGPSYVLPDEYLIGQESLVRNLLIGRRVCGRFGGRTSVAYYPDTFGHVAQMPQIARGFGLDSFVFWRGLGEESDDLGLVFRWRAPDGSEVLAIRQIDGYHSLRKFGRWTRDSSWDASEVKEVTLERAILRVEELLEAARPELEKSGLRDLAAFNGVDHDPIQAGLPALLRECEARLPGVEFRVSGLDEYVDAVRSAGPNLAEYRGEMSQGRHAHVLRGVNSTRIYLKQRNEAVERALQEAEVACSLAALRGHPYPTAELRTAWKYLLQNHPHDSICGCSIDQVHREMTPRFDAAEQVATRLRREALWKMAGGEAAWTEQDAPAAAYSAVNLLPWERSGVVELSLPAELARAKSVRVDGPGGALPAQVVRRQAGPVALVAVDAPGFGAAALKLSRGSAAVEGACVVGDRAIENECYRVEVLENGTLEVVHKPTGRRLSDAHRLEDEADRGDEYNFCPVEGDIPWDSRNQRVRVRRGMEGPAVASLLLQIEARLPSALRSDRRGRRRAKVSCPVLAEVRLAAGADRVEFVTTVENRAKDHRLRVVFPALSPTDGVRVEGHYAVLHRRVGAGPHSGDWTELPSPTHHTLGFVEAGGTTVFGKGLPEYEARGVEGGTEVVLTLLRCVGWLSREDLSTRPGWAGPGIPTPEAQCPGLHRFEYALSLTGEAGDAELARRSQDYRFGLLAGPSGMPQGSLLSITGDGFCLGALKGAEEDDGLILRVYNPGDVDADVSVDGEVSVEPCRLDEEREERPFDGRLAPGRIQSLRLRHRR